MERLLIICGPTATGKTSLGVELAEKYNGEIVSADSRQIYKGMDIGTGKDLPVNAKFKNQNAKLQIKNQKFTVGYRSKSSIRIWLVDIVSPDVRFSVSEYVNLAGKVIADIKSRGKLPIVVGGTGFYISSLLSPPYSMGITEDRMLRKNLEKHDREELASELKRLNISRWVRMNRADRLNPRRLIRAIEIARFLKKSGQKADYSAVQNYDSLIIGLKSDMKKLYERIDLRVEARVKKGIIDEIKSLLKKGYDWTSPGFNTLGYKQWRDYFLTQYPIPNTKYWSIIREIITRWKYDEHGYARRQMTWFKKKKDINWFDIDDSVYQTKIEKLVRDKFKSRAIKRVKGKA